MIRKILLLSLIISTMSCSSVKRTQEAINYGNYDEAINIAIKQLRSNKTKKSNQEYVLLLEEAFKKVTDKDLETISFLEANENPSNLETIYNSYLNLKYRQDKIKPLLPLPILNKNKNATFVFNNYTNNIVDSKNKLSEYLYQKSENDLKTATNKNEYRTVFDDLTYLEKINSNYKNTKALLEEAHFKGTNFIFVSLKNKTDQVLPARLEADLLNFDTYKMQNLWTVYHNNYQKNVNYDYEIEINFKDINISPEQIKEKQLTVEKQVVDGWKYLIDTNGIAVKDSLGNKIKVDKFKTIRCTLNEVTQYKAAQVVGIVNYFNINTNQLVKSFPLASEFIFENSYGSYKGNRSALEQKHLNLLGNKYIPFPSNEQMIYDSGEDLKNNIKNIITQNRFEY